MIEILGLQLFLAVLATVALTAAASGAGLRMRYREERVWRVVPTLTALFLVLNTVLLVWRAVQVSDARHVLANRFDLTLLFATTVTVVAFHSQLRPAIRGLDTFVLPVALFIQVLSFLGMKEPQLPGSIRSWFVVHQISFVLGATFLVYGGVAGGAYLLLSRVLRNKQTSSLLWRMAPLEAWERSGRWGLLFGFLSITFGVLTGICQASRLEETTSREWVTDGFIVACIVVWVLYAIGMAATWIVPRFRGRRSAQLAVASGIMLMVVFLIIEQLSVVHR